MNPAITPKRRTRTARISVLMGLLLIAPTVSNCGRIVDPDNVVVATVDGKDIRQRDFFNYLRRLSDVDRPLIQTREDAVAALNAMINARILDQYADNLKATGQIQVPREFAKEAYFAKYPEQRLVFEIPDATLIDRTEQDLEGIRAQVDFGIDDEEARLYREAALHRMAQDAHAEGRIAVSDQELEAEYAAQRRTLTAVGDEPVTGPLIRNERIQFIGIRFPDTDPEARAKAVDVLQRVEAGETFESIVDEFRQRDPAFILESEFENDPYKPKFMTFWETVSGREEGDVVLAFLPEFTVTIVSPAGQPQSTPMPPSHIVLKIQSHAPKSIMTFEEARSYLLSELLRRKMMIELRDKHRAAVFPEKLHDPAGFGDQFKGSQIQTTPN